MRFIKLAVAVSVVLGCLVGLMASSSGQPVRVKPDIKSGVDVEMITSFHKLKQCIDATGTTLNQARTKSLAILNKVLADPLGCERPLISQERLDWLDVQMGNAESIAFGSRAMRRLVCSSGYAIPQAMMCIPVPSMQDDLTSKIRSRVNAILCYGGEIKSDYHGIINCTSD